MKINVNSRTVFRCPTGIFTGSISAFLLCRSAKRKGLRIARKQMKLILREAKKYKKAHPEWNMAEITQPDGKLIVIEI